MDVSSSEWKSKAVSNITKYLHRGGEYKGDEPQFIGGTDLLNTIGMAMGLPMSDPDTWSKTELERALQGQLVFFEDKAREAIDVVAKQIRSCCGGDDKNFVTVLPIELYHEGKLYEVPLFRVKRYEDSKNYYVDNIGRRYDTVSDWYEFSKLPPGQMAYPRQLKLTLESGSENARVDFAKTPCSRLDAKSARGLDTVSAVLGLGSSVGLLFVTGGLAAPLVGTALVTAGYGTTRAGCQIIDKAMHGESVNPFKNSESRMLWLGIAANLASFGAMGASMHITSLAARGRNISVALKLVTNIANGTNVTVSAVAILNSTIFMIKNHENLSALDILMQSASIAFWMKGAFSFKTANTIIRETQNYAFDSISKQLNQELTAELSALRNEFQNDAQLLQIYYAAMTANIPVEVYSQFLIDAMRYYETLSNLTPDKLKAFHNLRNFIKDDINLINGLNRAKNYNGWSRSETMDRALNLWQQRTQTNFPSETGAMLRDGNILLGRAPPIKIDQLPTLSTSMMHFYGEHLSQIDVAATCQWSTTVLINLQSRGMFTICPVTRIVQGGRAVILLNNQLEISIYTLQSMSHENCQKVFKLISSLPASVTSGDIKLNQPDLMKLLKLCVRDLRLRFQCQRVESVNVTKTQVANHSSLLKIVQAELKSYEQDRLYTFVSEVTLYKSDIYMENMMKFVSEMRPNNVSELVAYCEFIITCVEDEMLVLNRQINNKELIPPRNTKLSVWKREKASEIVFRDIQALKQKFNNILKVVRNNNMAGVTKLASNLSETELIAAIRRENIRFGSEISAVYHILKHPTEPLDVYVRRANETIRSTAPTSSYHVSIGQDGDVRTIQFKDNNGKCFLLERDGCVFLCSYMPTM